MVVCLIYPMFNIIFEKLFRVEENVLWFIELFFMSSFRLFSVPKIFVGWTYTCGMVWILEGDKGMSCLIWNQLLSLHSD